MRVIICGAGQVGFTIAHQLSSEGNDVTILDQAEDLIQNVNDRLDVKAIRGFASHPGMLEAAGATDADMVIAVTRSDEVNMVACQVAHALFNVPTKIARIRSQAYLDTIWSELYRHDHLPIDVIISPEREVAQTIVRRLHLPGAIDMIPFADGKIRVVAVRCMLDCPVLNLPVSTIAAKAEGLRMRILGIVRDNRFFIPSKHDTLLAGDDIYFATDIRDVSHAMALFGMERREARKIIILGGGNIGFYIAKTLEDDDLVTNVKVIERSKERAEYIAERLKRTTVINGDGLQREIMNECNIAAAETFISVTNDDEVNVLASLLAKRYGGQRSIALLNNMSYVSLMNNLGIDVIVNPRETTISSILQHVRRGKVRAVRTLRDGQAELIEAEAMKTSPIVDRPLSQVELPPDTVIAAILRGETVIMPDEDTVLQEYDRVLICCLSGMVRKVERMFSVGLEFF